MNFKYLLCLMLLSQGCANFGKLKGAFDSDGKFVPYLSLEHEYRPDSKLNCQQMIESNFNLMGVCHYYQGNLPMAEYFVQLALAKTQNQADHGLLYNNLGVIAFQLGRYAESKQLLSTAQNKLASSEAGDYVQKNKTYIQQSLALPKSL